MIATTGFQNLTLVSGTPSYVLSALADRIALTWKTVLGTENRTTPRPELGMYTLGEQLALLIEGRDGLRSTLKTLSIITADGTADLTKEEEYLVEESLREFDSILSEIQSLIEAYSAISEPAGFEKETAKTEHDRLLARAIFTKDVSDMLGSSGYLGFGRHDGISVFTSFLAWRRAKEFLSLSSKDEKALHGLKASQIREVQDYLRSGMTAYNLTGDNKTIEALFHEISAGKARVLSEK